MILNSGFVHTLWKWISNRTSLSIYLFYYFFDVVVDVLITMPPLLVTLPKTSHSQMDKVVARVSRSLGGWLLGWGLDQQMDNPVFVSLHMLL